MTTKSRLDYAKVKIVTDDVTGIPSKLRVIHRGRRVLMTVHMSAVLTDDEEMVNDEQHGVEGEQSSDNVENRQGVIQIPLGTGEINGERDSSDNREGRLLNVDEVERVDVADYRNVGFDKEMMECYSQERNDHAFRRGLIGGPDIVGLVQVNDNREVEYSECLMSVGSSGFRNEEVGSGRCFPDPIEEEVQKNLEELHLINTPVFSDEQFLDLVERESKVVGQVDVEPCRVIKPRLRRNAKGRKKDGSNKVHSATDFLIRPGLDL